MKISTITLIYFIVINILTLIVYGIDKYRAIHGKWRISEATLFLLALIGGSIGAEIGMYGFHHKTRHPRFVIGIPAILLLQAALLFILKFRLHLPPFRFFQPLFHPPCKERIHRNTRSRTSDTVVKQPSADQT